jgi:predicted ATPase/DNA-binding SARP family transcriptional activator
VRTAGDRVLISVLGPLAVTAGDGRPVPVGGRRVRGLLILLALDAGRPVPARVLIERLWPGDRDARPPVDAANALQSLVSRLRVALRQAGLPDSVLESSSGGYRLAVAPGDVDALAFEARAKAGSRALAAGDAATAAGVLRAALAGWRGPALADVAGAEFAVAPAARLEELRSAATLDRVEADIVLGEVDGGLVGELRELTTADPLAERPAALLMRALGARGRQAEALAVYGQIRGRLAEDLGVDPSVQLERTHLAILRQEVTVPDVPGSGTGGQAAGRSSGSVGARRPPTSFVGRADDVAGVVKRLAAERLVTLSGPGGVGKTRLATEAAASLGVPVWFAALAPVTAPSEVPYAMLDALGLRERSIAPRGADATADPVGRLCAALAASDAVLLLDNCEHVIDAAADLAAALLADCPRVQILATSREPLHIPGETLYPVSPLPQPLAVRLFADRAAAVLPGFTVDAANRDAVARICRALDGVPLAIELATPWLRALTPEQLADRLDDRFALLTGGSRTALPRHQTLRAVVDWSWNLLSESERALARRLAVFPGGATLTAAERIGASGTAVGGTGAVLPALAGLVDKSILATTDAAPGGGLRYRMLETVRAYGLERLAEAGEETQVRDLFTGFYVDLAETADPLLRSAEQTRWFRELAAEQDNMLAAVRAAIARGDAARALRFVRALGYYWIQRGHGESHAIAREVLAMTPPPLTKELAEARVICAMLAAGRNWDIGSIREPLAEALAALAAFGDDHIAFHPLVAMAEPLVLQYDGHTDRALARFEHYEATRDPWLHAIGQVYLSSYDVALGLIDDAERHARAGLGELRAIGEQWGIAVALTQLAEITELDADHAASIAALEEAAVLGRDLGVWSDLMYVEGRLGIIQARAGDLAAGCAQLAAAERAIAARGELMDTDRWVNFMRAEFAWLTGDYAAAAECCATVLAAIRDNAAPWWHSLRALVKARFAMAVLRQGDAARCLDLLGQAVDHTVAWREHPALAAVLDACAGYVIHRGRAGDLARAARLLGAGHAIRGAFDESSLDAPAAREAARDALGAGAFGHAYESARELTYEAALDLARQALSGQLLRR